MRKPNSDKPRERSTGKSGFPASRSGFGEKKDAPKSFGDKKPYADRTPRSFDYKKPYADRAPRSFDDKKPHGDRAPRSFDNKKPYSDRAPRSYDDKKPYGDRAPRSFDDKKPYSDRAPRSYDDKKPYPDRAPRSFDDKKPYADRAPRSFDDKKPYSDRAPRSYDDKKPYSDRAPRSYDDKKPYSDRAPRSFDDKKPYADRAPRSFDDKKPYSDRAPRSFDDKKPYADRAPRSFDDKKPYADRAPRSFDDKKPYSDRAPRSYDDKRPFTPGAFGNKKSFVAKTSKTVDEKKNPFPKTEEKRTRKTILEPLEEPLKKIEFSKQVGLKIQPEITDNGMMAKLPPRLKNKVVEKMKGTSDIRLNRYIANAGLCSRREADEFIASGQITVNGAVVVEMGYRVEPDDVVKYGRKILNRQKLTYILLNKPKDFITTTEDPEGRKTVMDLIKNATTERVYPVGRLDRATTGLLLLTNDGELAEKLSHPSYQTKKIYQLEIDKKITQEHFDEILAGVTLEDGEIKADDLSVISPDGMVLGIEIHSGKNRIVRRLFEHLGYEVLKLDRSTYAGLTKKDLPRGNWRYLSEKEVIRMKYLV